MKKYLLLLKKHWRIVVLIIYIISPIDIVPDFLLPLGVGDDLIVLALTLRSYLKEGGLSNPIDDFKKAAESGGTSNESKIDEDNIVEGEIVD